VGREAEVVAVRVEESQVGEAPTPSGQVFGQLVPGRQDALALGVQVIDLEDDLGAGR
jgi:hypothetical protein